jgi:hypothetical protein
LLLFGIKQRRTTFYELFIIGNRHKNIGWLIILGDEHRTFSCLPQSRSCVLIKRCGGHEKHASLSLKIAENAINFQ